MPEPTKKRPSSAPSRNIEPEEDTPPAETVEEGAPEWMVTFGDMMSLLLCFFILLLSFANVDLDKFQSMLNSVRDALTSSYTIWHGSNIQISSVDDEVEEPQRKKIKKKKQPQEGDDSKAMNLVVFAQIAQYVVETLGHSVQVEQLNYGVKVIVDSSRFFDSGQSKIKDSAQSIMNFFGSIMLKSDRYNLLVEGHTDNVPLNSRYISNWDLSFRRALSVTQFLINKFKISPKRLIATGQGDTRPRAKNDTPEGRAKNRRVEFLFFSLE